MIKCIAIIVGLAAVVAPPASAFARDVSATVREPGAARVTPNPNDVWVGNKYEGTDPDPFVRGQMLRQFKDGMPKH